VDSNGGVHVVWDTGQNARYRSRPAGGEWIPIAELGKGNFLQIAGDNQGGVHIVRSADFNIVYCRATLGSACADVKVFDAADDLQPSIGANANGSILVVFRDSGNKSLWYNAIENGAWTASTVLDSGTTPPDVTSRSYTTRFGVAWSLDFDAQVKTVEISGSSRPAGSIVINPKFTGLLGGPGVTNPFDVTVNNAGGQATSVTLRAEGMAERTEPFTGNTVTIRGLQIATNAACERKTISGTLTGPAGTSEEFSTTVWVDRAVDATITTVEELGDPNADNDVIYLRIASGPNECSGLASYRVDFPGTAANPDVTGEIFVTGETVTIPLDGLDQGTHQMNVTLVDKAGLSKTEQFSIVKDSSRPVASARTPLPVTKRGGSFVTLDLSGIQYSDTTSGTPNNQRWGLRVVTQRSDQPVPTDAVLADRGVVVPGTANSLPWNVALGLVGGFTPRQNYTIYVQALDAAGNASGVIASAPVQIDALSGRIFMPIISGPAQ
jgi:hypothetical protein